MSFLRAEWRKLAIVNYVVPPALLQPYLPKQTTLDLWNEGCYISLVGFMFQNTRLLGIPIPFHIHFEEINLRFYVRHWDGAQWKRGVVFIREIVPKPAITWVANTIYHEHYATRKMWHQWQNTDHHLKVTYGWQEGSAQHQFSLFAEPQAVEIPVGSKTEFITEHYWGYAAHGAQTVEYEVRHPRWQHYPVYGFDIGIDFSNAYGQPFAFLNQNQPASVMLAEGSAITVEKRRFL